MNRRAVLNDRRGFLNSLASATALVLIPHITRGSTQKGAQDLHHRTSFNCAPAMAAAATEFLRSLNADQRSKATFTFDDEQRFDWNFIPKIRKGLTLKEMRPDQQHLVTALLGSGLGQRGMVKAASIMSLEPVLADIEKGSGPIRDPQLYYVTVFGEPDSKKRWGWRFEGHHISVNYSVIDDQRISSTPFFFGSNPAEILQGPRAGFRVHGREEDLGRAFVKSLDDSLRRQAVLVEAAPREILSGNLRKADPLKPAGVPAGKLGQKQVEMLLEILGEYASNVPADVAAVRLDRIRAAGIREVHFAWAGSLDKGQGHYYRIQGPTFLIEFDNTQNNANHIHTVWREFTGDWGQDLLAMHYKESHSHHG
ncbi:MAG TPA: DUF3500 domain-containing protein [Blastocatellia bacterium]|nr:DUF3500 domain-containing protein [Blastocatellia bacterium]